MEWLRRGPGRSVEHSVVVALTIGVLIVGWAVTILVDDRLRFVVVSPRARTGFEVGLALGQLFAALVLLLFPEESHRPRLRWVSLGLVVFGLGTFGFGYLLPVWTAAGLPSWVSADLSTTMYGSILVRTLGTGLLTIGLGLRRPPRLSTRMGAVVILAYASAGLGLLAVADRLPLLTTFADLDVAMSSSRGMMGGLTGWHWALSCIPLLLGLGAAIGAIGAPRQDAMAGWLLIAVTFLTGAHLHTLFWPSAFSTVLTTSSLLRLGFTVTLTIGGIVALRRVATEREERLAFEREYGRRLADLVRLRADFTAMVVHELSNPLAAIRRSAEVLELGRLSPEQARAIRTIGDEARALAALVEDVGASAVVERDDFAVQLRPVSLGPLLEGAAAFARTLPGEHPLTVEVEVEADGQVLADAERIAQVLRNLLENAAKHTPPGTPIALRAGPEADRVRVEVSDAGPGIPPEDLRRIFEKFGRGRTATGRRVPGVGLGLYLSRRILRLHGCELIVTSAPGEGTTFGFALLRGGAKGAGN